MRFGMHPQLINMDLQEGMVIKGTYLTHPKTFTIALCKCKWFTFTWDLHIVYVTIDNYMHNTSLNMNPLHPNDP
jgi:hypothetical protein